MSAHKLTTSVSPRDKTILMIDDDPDVLFTTGRILENAGYQVVSGSTAKEAETMVRALRPAMALLDVELPDGDGIEIAKRIKSESELDDVFVVLLSGKRILPEHQAEGLRAGLADAYIVRPITRIDFVARIEAFLRIRAARELLRAKNEELERFAYSVAHDLKSPLLTISGFVEILEQELGDSAQDGVLENLSQIRSAARKMNTLLTDLLKFNQVGNVSYASERVNLKAVVKDARAAISGLKSERRIDWQIAERFPEVYGDHERLSQMMQNLFENAVKYLGSQPEPRIECGSADSARGLACYVRDNGKGVEAEAQARVFDLFWRQSKDNQGSGVGLALVKRIIERHDGQIWLESAGEGRGTTFWFTLPWA